MQPTGDPQMPPDDASVPYTGPPPTRPYEPPAVPSWQTGQARFGPPPGELPPYGRYPSTANQQAPYAGSPYPSGPYAPGMVTPPPYGSYAPYGVAQPPRRTPQILGWALIAAAVVVGVGSLLPWATGFGGLISKAGTSGDGSITLAVAVLLAGAGLLIGLGRGRVGLSIAAVVLSALVCLIAVIDILDISDRNERFGDLIDIGYGLWVTLVGGLLTLGVSIVALISSRGRADRAQP